MPYAHTLAGTRYIFDDLRTLLARATPFRSGDALAGLAANSAAERVAAQMALADVPLTTILAEPVVAYETDEVTRLIVDTHDTVAFAPVATLTVGEFREFLLAAEPETLAALRPGITPEMAAAVSKLMRLQDLIAVAAKMPCRHPLPQHDRPARPSLGAPAAQPSDRRSAWHRRLHARRPAAWRRRCGDRRQSGDRQRRCRMHSARHARRGPRALRHPDADLRAGARHHDDARDRTWRASRPRVPVDRRHRGSECQLRRLARAAARGPRGGAVAAARNAGQQRDVFRDRPGQRVVRRRASRRRSADASRRAPTPSPAPSRRCWSTP